jgi:hypothetical protein
VTPVTGDDDKFHPGGGQWVTPNTVGRRLGLIDYGQQIDLTLRPIIGRDNIRRLQMEYQTTVKKSAISRTKLNLLLDIALFLIFVVTFQAKATGITVHEWLGVGIIVVIITHILLHWQWVVSITQQFFRKLKAEPRINYIVNLAIFAGFTTMIFSGLMISHSVLPFFGLEVAASGFWKMLHKTSADVTVWLTALHVALHWRWIVNAVKRYVVVAPVGHLLGRKPRQERQNETISA